MSEIEQLASDLSVSTLGISIGSEYIKLSEEYTTSDCIKRLHDSYGVPIDVLTLSLLKHMTERCVGYNREIDSLTSK